jgi:hypothetical protein
MLRMTFMSSAVAALLVCTACDQPTDQTAQRDQQAAPSDQAMNEPQATGQPTTMDQQQTGANPMEPQQTAAGIPLTDVPNPQQTLTKAPVKDAKGEAIGEVQSVSLGPDGKVQVVNVGMGTRTVALEASSLKYVQAENTLISDRSKDEIQKMP